uniref:Uncharacterized protein n=1 Tax=Trichuris muris TaxID=70415 RepID=A0A5S6R4X8_TRIMR
MRDQLGRRDSNGAASGADRALNDFFPKERRSVGTPTESVRASEQYLKFPHPIQGWAGGKKIFQIAFRQEATVILRGKEVGQVQANNGANGAKDDDPSGRPVSRSAPGTATGKWADHNRLTRRGITTNAGCNGAAIEDIPSLGFSRRLSDGQVPESIRGRLNFGQP